MREVSQVQAIDVAIIGGGIAGLWTLAMLRKQGYSAILLEKAGLGAGQTIASQGIIHGGTKYALTGQLSGAAQAITAMPGKWKAALQGMGEIDLSHAKQLSEHQYLWTTQALGGKLTAFFAGKMMQNRMTRLSQKNLPDFLPANFQGHCYALEEPVLDLVSILQCFAEQFRDCIITDANWEKREEKLIVNQQVFLPTTWLNCAGEANAQLSNAKQQIRPLLMTALKIPTDAPDIYGHCLGMSDKPKITITTHPYDYRNVDMGKVYWIGGQPAEEGVGREYSSHIQSIQQLLQETLPWLPPSWTRAKENYQCIPINRAEGAAGGKRPDFPVIEQQNNEITIWPTKLAFAPFVAEKVIARLPASHYSQPAFPQKEIRLSNYCWTKQ
ncbi:FAD-dependent oxidoreductase [Suttonella ornithocola]|uniref:FAD dependent oxidoreductase n=1 Tax=Suttonella ornithocola TaxID=279832 RepID=A0A380MNN3_9GAMM|nr:FAD-dependent oxidoreductase [Suttonella ornithocola]SUO94235.1 FAD dependent oxidoreductase [Suttonella ornithocola]